MKEIWKYIEGYDGMYKISNLGNVVSYHRNKKTFLKRRGIEYSEVVLHKNKIANPISIHRLVAQAFLSNPNNYPIVNHKNKNKFDNRVENLEWVTSQQNTMHARTHANLVTLGSREGRVASVMIPTIKKLVPFTNEFKCVNRNKNVSAQ